MASDSSEGSLFDQTVPPWKKELLLRKKLHGRGKGVWSIQLNNKYGAEDFHPVRNMRLLTKEPSDYINSNVEKETKFKMIEDRIMKRHSSRLNKLQADYLQSIKNVDLNGKDDVDGGSDSSEELQYGPGIVNKLKSKYLSMTLRDNHKYSSRPSLANLRRATSLENMLEDESKNQPKSHFIKKSSSPNWPKGNKISQHHAKYLGISKGESMKRARSMDTLFKNEIKNVVRPNGMTQSVIANEDLVIVDRDTDLGVCKSSFPDDKELPPPDVVKQTKKIFEKTSDALNSDNKNKKTVLSKANNLKVGSSTSFYDKQLDRVKPQLGPKPVFSGENKRSWPNKRIYPVVTSKPSPPPSPVKSSPRPDVAPRVVGIDTKPRLPSVTVKPQSSDGPASPVRATFVPVDDGRPSSPSKDGGSPVSKFIGDNALSSYFPRRNLMQATNPCLIKHQSSESASQSVKQVAVIRPIPAKKPLTEQEIENNLINSAKNNKKNPVDDSAESSDSEQVQAWEKKSWQSANSMVFNFSSRPSVPDYIENDGLAVSNRVAPKNNTNRDEVDVDEDWEAPQFCDVSFVGDNVLINGKSNLRKESTPTKVQSRRIQFNDEATTLYEYPSEDSLIEDTLSEPQSPQTSPQPPTPSPSPLGGATLSRYISSKSPTPTDFELGVTSSASVLSHSQHSVQKDQQRDEFVKLADCETAWSQETTSDILF